VVLSRRRKPFHNECLSLTDNSKISFLRIHRLILLVSLLLVTSIAVSLYFGSFKPRATRAITISWPFEFSLNIAKDSFQQGEYIPINLTLRNISNKTTTVVWSSYFLIEDKFLPFDVLVTDSNDTYIYQVSKLHGHLASFESRALEPGAQLVATFVWHQWADRRPQRPLVQKGTYFVKELSRSMEVTMDGAKQVMQLQTPAISFTIK